MQQYLLVRSLVDRQGVERIFLFFRSELAQKTQAEREAKRLLHEAGVAKKNEIIAQSANIRSERQVRSFDRAARGKRDI